MTAVNPSPFRGLVFKQLKIGRFGSALLASLEAWIGLCKEELDTTLTLDLIKELKENAVFVTASTSDGSEPVGYYIFNTLSLIAPVNEPRELLYLCVDKEQRGRGKSYGITLMRHWELQHVNASPRNVDILLEIDAIVGVGNLPLSVPQFYAINRFWPVSIVRSENLTEVDLIRMRKVLHVDDNGDTFVRLPRFAVEARAEIKAQEEYYVRKNADPAVEKKKDLLRIAIPFGKAGVEMTEAATYTINNYLFGDLIENEDGTAFVGVMVERPLTASGARDYKRRFAASQAPASSSSTSRRNVARQRKGSRTSRRPSRLGQ